MLGKGMAEEERIKKRLGIGISNINKCKGMEWSWYIHGSMAWLVGAKQGDGIEQREKVFKNEAGKRKLVLVKGADAC